MNFKYRTALDPRQQQRAGAALLRNSPNQVVKPKTARSRAPLTLHDAFSLYTLPAGRL